MEPLQTKQSTAGELGVVTFGLVLAIVGLTWQDTVGITPMLAAVGIALVVGGVVYIAVDGPEPVRFVLAFAALVAVQLLAVSGVLRWAGAATALAIATAVGYSRLTGVEESPTQ